MYTFVKMNIKLFKLKAPNVMQINHGVHFDRLESQHFSKKIGCIKRVNAEIS